MNIVGVLPMAGTGSRLGMPFHKSLSPTFRKNGEIVPLYRHSYERLLTVTKDVFFVVSPEGSRDVCLASLPGRVITKKTRGESPSSIAFAANECLGDWIALALPDTIWEPQDAFLRASELLDESIDGVLMTFNAPANIVDKVVSDGEFVNRVSQKSNESNYVKGWGAFIAKASRLAEWTDELPISEHLNRMMLKSIHFDGEYNDLGTPNRYRDALERVLLAKWR